MRKAFWGMLLMMMLVVTFAATGCVITQPAVDGETGNTGYPGIWEEATLITDEFGSELIVVRENQEKWVLVAKTYCFWTRNYVGRTVLLKWGPVESLLMNEAGESCEFWTRKRLD